VRLASNVSSSSVLLFLLLTVSVAGIFSIPSVFAEEQTVRIPIGAASPSCADDDSCYVSSKIRTNEGYEVKWINDDSVVHTVTSGSPSSGHDGFFDSGMIRPHGEFEFTFNGFKTDTYPYYCIAHPWMVGSVTVVDSPVGVMDDDDDITKYDSEDSLDDAYEMDSDSEISKESHVKSTLLENQRMFGKYKITVDWIRDIPAVNEINGIEILISDTTKKGSHGSSGGCGGGDHGDNKESHGDSMKGMSSHEDKGKHGDSMKGKGGHEGGCPHFQMVKKMIPQIELLENGVSQVDRSMMIMLSLGNSELTMPIVADENLLGRYTAVFVPTVAGKYGVEVHGTIHGSPVSMMIEMDKVLDKTQVTRFP